MLSRGHEYTLVSMLEVYVVTGGRLLTGVRMAGYDSHPVVGVLHGATLVRSPEWHYYCFLGGGMWCG